MTLVSVIVPVYNGESFVAECIESVLAQTHRDWELLIVDDGSSDRSATIAQEYAGRDPRVRLLFHDGRCNRGVSVSRRLAIANSRGSYLALLDADDSFQPDKLQRQLDAAEQHPECVVFHCGASCVDANGDILPSPHWADEFNAFAQRARVYNLREDESFMLRNSVLNSSALIRSEAVRKMPYGFDQLFQYEDWTLWILMSELGPFYVQPEPMVRYRMHDSSATHAVVGSPLVATYSYIEFLLSVIALTQQSDVSQRAVRILENQLGLAVQQYRRATGTPVGFDILTGRLDAGRIAQPQDAHPVVRRNNRWFRRLWKKKVSVGGSGD